MRKLIFVSLFILFCSSCVHNEHLEKGLVRTFKATGESFSATKTVLLDNQVLWSPDDSIKVFNAICTGGVKYLIDRLEDGKNEAAFSGTDIGEGPWYALYPYSGQASLKDGALCFSLPGTQRYGDNSFGPEAYPMVAKTNGGTLPFKNLCGLLHVQLKGSGTLESVTLTSSRDEALWGTAVVNMDYSDVPELIMTQAPDEEHKSITINCFDGLTLGEEVVNCYFVIPPGTLKGGFSITVTDNFGYQFSKTATASLEISRSSLKHMAPLSCPLTGSKLLSCTEWGVYDISGAEAMPLRVFGKDDQAALRSGIEMQFRIQSLVSANALIISFPSAMTEGEASTLAIQSVGSTGVADATVSAVLLKKEDGKCWLEDAANNIGYIIADKL